MNYFSFDYKNNFFNITDNIGSPEYYQIRKDFFFNFRLLMESLHCETYYVNSICTSLFNAMLSEKVYYHTPVHIMSIFDFAEAKMVDVSYSQQLAIFFHDAIYRPGSKFNEENSIKFMKALLAGCGVNGYVIEEAVKYIEATALHLSDNVFDDNIQLVMDLDMSGFSSTTFDTQNAMIELEFCQPNLEHYGYTVEQFLKGRMDFLQKLNSKKNIYRTEFMVVNKYETLARNNLTRAISNMQERLSKLT